MTLNISLFGRFSVLQNDRPAAGFEPQKVQELLSYLLLFPDKPHHREQLASTLWENCDDTAQSKKYLRKTLWQLQNGLANLGLADSPLLVDNDWIELGHTEGWTSDIDLLTDSIKQTRQRPGRLLNGREVALLQAAVAAYKGDLLEGVYHNWCILERERYHFIFLVLLDKLIDYCLEHRLYDDGFAYGIRVLQHDPAREHTHRQLMWLRYLAGDRTGALRQYTRCAEMLLDELGVEPALPTRQLYEHIREDQIPLKPPPSTSLPDGPENGRHTVDLSEVHRSLHQLRRELHDHLGLILVTASQLIQTEEKESYFPSDIP